MHVNWLLLSYELHFPILCVSFRKLTCLVTIDAILSTTYKEGSKSSNKRSVFKLGSKNKMI
jgi:hypothetical protein